MLTEVTGSGGTRLAVRVEGPAAASSIVLVHGWAQSGGAFGHLLGSPVLTERFRLVAPDLRGHGCSEVAESGYAEPRVWADDLAAVLRLAGTPAVVLGWSYGGLVIADYLRTHGTAGLAGLFLVGAITEIGRARPGGIVGSAMRAALPDALAEDLAVALPALSGLATSMAARQGGGPLAQRLLGTSLAVPPAVRSALFRRDLGSAEALGAVDVPTTVVHGSADTVVHPDVAHYALGKIPGARMRWMDGVGHLPFVEAAEDFSVLLRRFAEDHLAG